VIIFGKPTCYVEENFYQQAANEMWLAGPK